MMADDAHTRCSAHDDAPSARCMECCVRVMLSAFEWPPMFLAATAHCSPPSRTAPVRVALCKNCAVLPPSRAVPFGVRVVLPFVRVVLLSVPRRPPPFSAKPSCPFRCSCRGAFCPCRVAPCVKPSAAIFRQAELSLSVFVSWCLLSVSCCSLCQAVRRCFSPSRAAHCKRPPLRRSSCFRIKMKRSFPVHDCVRVLVLSVRGVLRSASSTVLCQNQTALRQAELPSASVLLRDGQAAFRSRALALCPCQIVASGCGRSAPIPKPSFETMLASAGERDKVFSTTGSTALQFCQRCGWGKVSQCRAGGSGQGSIRALGSERRQEGKTVVVPEQSERALCHGLNCAAICCGAC